MGGVNHRHYEERKRRSNPDCTRDNTSGLLRGACHRAALRAGPLARNDDCGGQLALQHHMHVDDDAIGVARGGGDEDVLHQPAVSRIAGL